MHDLLTTLGMCSLALRPHCLSLQHTTGAKVPAELRADLVAQQTVSGLHVVRARALKQHMQPVERPAKCAPSRLVAS